MSDLNDDRNQDDLSGTTPKITLGQASADEVALGSSTKKLSVNFVQEVEMLAGLYHVNIVQLVGFLEDLDRDKAWIVLSWESNGNVREFLASGQWEIPERLSL
ncbi:hypothetical protein FRC00_013071, partial [Tulasnella sp. 408]